MLKVVAVLLELLADLALMRGVLAKLLRELLLVVLLSGCIGLETFRAQRNMRL